jgi:hypothetical protein
MVALESLHVAISCYLDWLPGSAIGSTLKGKYGEFGTGGEFRTPKLQRVEYVRGAERERRGGYLLLLISRSWVRAPARSPALSRT